MTKKPSRVRVLMMPYQDDEDGDQVGYTSPPCSLACHGRSDGMNSD
jgi:hypothetical protein